MKQLACRGRVRYWALVVSVAVHAAALAVFTGVKLSGRRVEAEPARPGLSMQMIEKAVEQSPPKPKPKVKPIKTAVEPDTPQPKPLVVEESILTPASETTEPVEPLLTESISHEVEFFGQKSTLRRICYVVDCSGSMYGQMYRVRSELKQSVLKLSADHAFTVLFFTKGQQILMSGSGRLEAATVSEKSAALELIDKIRPGGSTDAAHALECAMRLRAADGTGPQVIYFLTDGFNLDEAGSLQFVEKIEAQRKLLAPSVVLHTIGFWPQENDRKMLDVLAGLTGGQYTGINE